MTTEKSKDTVLCGVTLKLAPFNKEDDFLSFIIAIIAAQVIHVVSQLIPDDIANGVAATFPEPIATFLLLGFLISGLVGANLLSALFGSMAGEKARVRKCMTNAAVVYFSATLIALTLTFCLSGTYTILPVTLIISIVLGIPALAYSAVIAGSKLSD